MSQVNLTSIQRLFYKVSKQVQKWEADASATIEWNGVAVKAIDQTTFEALQNLCEISSVAADDIHEGARGAVLAIDEFARQFELFSELVQGGSQSGRPRGTPEMWSAFEMVRLAVDPPKPPQLEPVRTLIERDGVPPWQVCKIYGWGSEKDGWEHSKVAEELDEPGKHSTNCESWEHPRIVANRHKVNEAWKDRKPVHLPMIQGRVERKPKESPESLQTLITQRVGIEQIMRMKNVTREEVEQEASRLGVNLQGARYVRPVDPLEQETERIADDKARQESADAKDLERRKQDAAKRVKSLLKGKKTPDEIQSVIAEEFPGIDVSGLVPVEL